MARLSPESLEVAREIIGRYPVTKSALIPLLHLAQEQDGHLTDDAMAHIAELLDLTPAEVLGTASFYEMFKRHHVGRYMVNVCTSIACFLNGGDELLHHAEQRLDVKAGGTTADGAVHAGELRVHRRLHGSAVPAGELPVLPPGVERRLRPACRRPACRPTRRRRAPPRHAGAPPPAHPGRPRRRPGRPRRSDTPRLVARRYNSRSGEVMSGFVTQRSRQAERLRRAALRAFDAAPARRSRTAQRNTVMITDRSPIVTPDSGTTTPTRSPATRRPAGTRGFAGR